MSQQKNTEDLSATSASAASAVAETASIEISPEEPAYSENAIHMIRSVQRNTLTLSRMADQKASILMGATFLVFSFSISRSLAGDVPYSLLLLAFFSFLSALCAVMAVFPSTKKRHPSVTPNRLFFVHFAALDEEEWIDSVLTDLRSDERIFRTMMHDIYQNGQVLAHRKYRFLSHAYRIFIGGLCMSLIAFTVETMIS